MDKSRKRNKVPAVAADKPGGRLRSVDEDGGLPPEVALDEDAGVEPKAVREVGDADEISAHGPDGDGAVATKAPDGQGLTAESDKGTSIDEL